VAGGLVFETPARHPVRTPHPERHQALDAHSEIVAVPRAFMGWVSTQPTNCFHIIT
jgi:hypothetical protein